MSADIKLSKAQINKIIQSGGALGSILGRFLPKLIKPAISLGKNILAPLGLSAAMSAGDAGIHKKIHGYGKTVKFSNQDIKDMTKIVKASEDSDVLMKGVTETFKSDIKKGGALLLIPMLLGTPGVSLLSGKGLFRAGSGNKCNCGQRLFRGGQGKGMYRAGKGLFKAGQGIKNKIINATTSFNNLRNTRLVL